MYVGIHVLRHLKSWFELQVNDSRLIIIRYLMSYIIKELKNEV